MVLYIHSRSIALNKDPQNLRDITDSDDSDECHAWFHLNAVSPGTRNTEQVNITKTNLCTVGFEPPIYRRASRLQVHRHNHFATARLIGGYLHVPFQVYLEIVYRYKFHGNLIPSHIKRVVAKWLWRWTCNLEAVRCCWFESYRGQHFCNVHLFRVPRTWTCSVQMKSSITFIRGNRCMESESKLI